MLDYCSQSQRGVKLTICAMAIIGTFAIGMSIRAWVPGHIMHELKVRLVASRVTVLRTRLIATISGPKSPHNGEYFLGSES